VRATPEPSNQERRNSFNHHLEETRDHVRRLEEIGLDRKHNH